MGAQADTQIAQRLGQTYRLFRYARERATIATMVPVIEDLMAGSPPEIVIVELGAGDAYERRTDAQMRTAVRRVLTLVRPAACVRWLNLKVGGVNGFYEGYVARADDFNRILRAEVARTPTTDDAVAPYRRWAADHPNSFLADGLHHTPRGKTRFAAFLDTVAATC